MRDFIDFYPLYTRFWNNHNNSRFFSFLYIVFYWNNNLSYVLASQTQQLKKVKIFKEHKRPTLLFIQRFFKIQNYCFALTGVKYGRRRKTIFLYFEKSLNKQGVGLLCSLNIFTFFYCCVCEAKT